MEVEVVEMTYLEQLETTYAGGDHCRSGSIRTGVSSRGIPPVKWKVIDSANRRMQARQIEVYAAECTEADILADGRVSGHDRMPSPGVRHRQHW